MEWGMSPMSAQPLPLIQLKSSLFHLFIQKRFSLNWKVWHFEFFAVTANFHNLFSVSVSLYWFVEMFSSAWLGSSSRSLNTKHVLWWCTALLLPILWPPPNCGTLCCCGSALIVSLGLSTKPGIPLVLSLRGNKFALLWGEAQLCLPYVCLGKKTKQL